MQKLELTWIGKDKVIAPEPRILLHDPSKDYGDPSAKNMLIHGDNLLALKALEQEFAGKVKCIYIDPPYNTGSAFEHYDDNLEHSTWLKLMRPRLELLRNLMMDSGSIWISIDDNEQAYLKVMCDEIFGRNCFVSTIIWRSSDNSNNDAKQFSLDHNYILVYSKTPGWVSNRIARNETQTSHYSNPDNDPRGPWFAGNPISSPHSRPNLCYDIIAPNGNVIKPPPYGWRWSEETLKEKLSTGEIFFNSNYTNIKRKTYLVEQKGIPPSTLWTVLEETGHNRQAKYEQKKLFPGWTKTEWFSTPKPERLLERILTIATSPGDIVLDSFLGSGTTAAVALKLGRQFIGIEFNGTCETHSLPRLKSVIDGEQGGISKAVEWKGGSGFKYYNLAPTLILKDNNGIEIFNPKYNADMIAAAVCKLCGYRYALREENPYIHGVNNVGGFIFVTTEYITAPMLSEIAKHISDTDSLVICASAFELGIKNNYPNIKLRKIPQSLLSKCEYGIENYNLSIVGLPDFDETEEDFEDVE